MRLRRNILPKTIKDALVTTFVVLIIPIVYKFEMFTVLPYFYNTDSVWYTFHFVLGTFILANISSNFLAIVMCDTSIVGKILPSAMQKHWRFCSVCECVAPPRSWHCDICKTCILKRDHHCIFTSCCIGHHNLRYFLMFIMYLFISTVYASYYNIYFVWRFIEINSLLTILKIIFPLAMVFVELTIVQFYLFLCIIIAIAGIFTGVLLYYHTNLMLRGMITYENNHKITMYDCGYKNNVKEVLGERWYLVWICPFIKSELRSDGIHWDIKNSEKAK